MIRQNKFVVTGIGTDVGKTVVSAILSQSLRGYYWKPVQAGDLENSDSMKIQRWTTSVEVLPEAFRLSQPLSPHIAAENDGVLIDAIDLQIPMNEPLIIEGAGGLMVPLNLHGLTYLDVFQQWKLPVIVVSKHYLGSINHTLMTCEMLRSRGLTIQGLIFVGEENKPTEWIIQKSTGLRMIMRVPLVSEITPEFIKEQAQRPELMYFFG